MDWIEANIVDLYKEGKTVCVTTNGFPKRDGTAVMGRGNAKAMATLIPELPTKLGAHIQMNGNHVGFIMDRVIAFPVKPMYGGLNECLDEFRAKQEKELQPGQLVPGWMCKADINLIRQSYYELVHLTEGGPEYPIYLPLPGCGNGGLCEEAIDKLNLDEYGHIQFVRIFE